MLASTLSMAISGVPGLLFSRRSMAGQSIATLLNLLATLLGIVALLTFMSGGYHSENMAWPWTLPWGGFAVGIDTITVLFLMPILGVSLLGSMP